MSKNKGLKYINGRLHCDGAAVADIADKYGTPCYIYSKETLLDRLKKLRKAFAEHDPLICFSVKSLSNLSILKLLAEQGCGFDIVSGGELYRVLKAGGDPAKTVFAGVGKTAGEIEFALRHKVFMFNVESKSEMRLIERVAKENGRRADVAIRINPDVDARTHEKTTTGKKENKFGIGFAEAFDLAVETEKMTSVNLRGLHIHLGSPIYKAEPYLAGVKRLAEFKEKLREKEIKIDTINLGGGYCASYTGEKVLPPKKYAETVGPELNKLKSRLVLEPGRYIAAPSGVLLAKVIYRKENSEGKRFVVIDAAMNDQLRPALYGAFHRIWPAESPKGMPEIIRPADEKYDDFTTEKVDIVGPVCESCDCMAKDRPIPHTQEGELIAIFDTGAYGFTMSSNYNGRPKAAEVLVVNCTPVLVSRRETYRDLIAHEELAAESKPL